MSRTTRSLAQNDVVYLDDDGGRLGCSRWSVRGRTSPRRTPRRRSAGDDGVRGVDRRYPGSGPARRVESEIKVAVSIPDLTFGLADADAVVRELQDPDSGMPALEVLPGKGGPARLFMSTKQTLDMLVRAARNTITDEERDRVIAHIAERLASTGPFK